MNSRKVYPGLRLKSDYTYDCLHGENGNDIGWVLIHMLVGSLFDGEVFVMCLWGWYWIILIVVYRNSQFRDI